MTTERTCGGATARLTTGTREAGATRTTATASSWRTTGGTCTLATARRATTAAWARLSGAGVFDTVGHHARIRAWTGAVAAGTGTPATAVATGGSTALRAWATAAAGTRHALRVGKRIVAGARGAGLGAAIGQNVFVRDDTVEGIAPTLTLELIEI